MYRLIIFNIFISLITTTMAVSHDWDYEILDIESSNYNPKWMLVDLEGRLIARGVFGISGTFDIKTDFSDDLFVEVLLYRSSRDDGSFIKSPLHFPKSNLTTAMNKLYKPYFMDVLKECAPKAPQFKTFKPPLKAVKIELHNCTDLLDNLPKHLDPGRYNMEFIFSEKEEGLIAAINLDFIVTEKEL